MKKFDEKHLKNIRATKEIGKKMRQTKLMVEIYKTMKIDIRITLIDIKFHKNCSKI